MKPIICNGWALFFHPLFLAQWSDLVEKVKELKVKKEKSDFLTHPSVKLLKAIDVGIKEKIPIAPFASHFILKKPLQKYSRLKKMGLPNLTSLFFRAFKEKKIIIILWLGFPRKERTAPSEVSSDIGTEQEGDKKDCYQVFSKKIAQGQFPDSLASLLAECQTEDSLTDQKLNG